MDSAWADYLPTMIAPDPGGLLAQAETLVLPVEPLQTPVQHSPQTSWSQGTPYPGPFATISWYADLQSAKWWGRTGQGQLIWSDNTETVSADLPPMIPQDMAQHIDVFQRFAGGFPSIARNRPTAFGDQVPILNPS